MGGCPKGASCQPIQGLGICTYASGPQEEDPEAAQALEASCWIPLLKGDRAILAGDHKQLPPTVKCDGIEAELLGRTLFERLMEDKRPGWNERRSVLLTTQYRMHGDICEWASAASYGGLLEAAPVCVRRDLYEDYLANDEDRLAVMVHVCLLYTSPSPRDGLLSRMPSSA